MNNGTYDTKLLIGLIVCLMSLTMSCKRPDEIEEDLGPLPEAYQEMISTYNPPAPGALNVMIEGIYLYERDKVEMLLRNREGKEYIITPTSYATDGKRMKFNLPTDIKPSQYSLQLMRRGRLVDFYSRFLVQTKDRTQPQLIHIRDANLFLLQRDNSAEPIQLQRNKEYGFNYVITNNARQVVVKLVSVNDPTKSFPFYVDQQETSHYNYYGPGFGEPAFTVPSSVPTGRYKLILQFFDEGKSTEGDPLERDIEVR